MKTAMQELIDEFQNELDTNRLNNDEYYIVKWAIYCATQKLEKEKKQILKAHINGQSEFDVLNYREFNNDLAEEYYNETYNQNQ